VLGVALTILTATFAWNRRAWDLAPTDEEEAPRAPGTMAEALRHPMVWAQMLAFFCYCGVESTAGNWGFTLLTQHRGLPVAQAGTAITCYWGALTAGRFLLGAFADRLGVYRLLGAAMTLALVAGLTFVLAPGSWLAMGGLTLLGFSLAPIYPGLMTQTPARLGHLANQAVGFQAGSAMLGAVCVPGLGGMVADRLGLAWLDGLLGALTVALALVIGGLIVSLRR
jgi:fucose permease